MICKGENPLRMAGLAFLSGFVVDMADLNGVIYAFTASSKYSAKFRGQK